MSETDETDEEGERITSIKELSERQDRTESKLDQILAVLGKTRDNAQANAREGQERKLDAPTSIAEEIRQQFEERDRKAAADAEHKSREDRLAAVETSLKEIAEKAPEPPARRIEKIMGWR